MAVRKVKIVDPKTGARVADPEFVGMKLDSGSVGSSWPEVRSQYQKGQRSAEFNRRGVPPELKNYLTGKTDKLSEDFDEPFVKAGGSIEYHRSVKAKPTKDPDPVNIEKLPVKTAKTAIKSATVKGPKTLKSRDFEKPEPASFESPGVYKKPGVKTTAKTVIKGALNSSRPGMAEKGQTKLKGARVTTTETNTTGKNREMMGYNREQKLHKAYAGTSVLGESHIGKTSTDIKSYKNDMKSQRREYRKEGNVEGVAATSMEVKQSRQAQRFAARGEKGKNVHFTDKNYQNTTGKTSRISPDYRNSAENAANRNTMQAKLDAISAKPKNNTRMY